MTHMIFNLDKNCFKREMKKLQAVFNDKKVTKGFLKIYYERLGYCSDKEFCIAIDQALDNKRWFPTIKDLKEFLPPRKSYINTPEFKELQKER